MSKARINKLYDHTGIILQEAGRRKFESKVEALLLGMWHSSTGFGMKNDDVCYHTMFLTNGDIAVYPLQHKTDDFSSWIGNASDWVKSRMKNDRVRLLSELRAALDRFPQHPLHAELMQCYNDEMQVWR